MVENNFDLKPINTFGISAIAEHFARFTSIIELTELLQKYPNEELLILGGGSNVLFTKNFEGLVLKRKTARLEMGTSELNNTKSQIKIRKTTKIPKSVYLQMQNC